MCYVSCRTEVDTHRFIKWRLGNSGQISVPRVDLVYKAIVASEIEDFAHDLHVGHFKILEPIHERVRLVAPEEIDLYIVPGVAFDRRGFRLGYGKGYYDAYLKKVAHDPIKIGLAYHPQLIDSIPESPWDIPVDMIVTNEDVIVCNGIYKKEV